MGTRGGEELASAASGESAHPDVRIEMTSASMGAEASSDSRATSSRPLPAQRNEGVGALDDGAEEGGEGVSLLRGGTAEGNRGEGGDSDDLSEQVENPALRALMWLGGEAQGYLGKVRKWALGLRAGDAAEEEWEQKKRLRVSQADRQNEAEDIGSDDDMAPGQRPAGTAMFAGRNVLEKVLMGVGCCCIVGTAVALLLAALMLWMLSAPATAPELSTAGEATRATASLAAGSGARSTGLVGWMDWLRLRGQTCLNAQIPLPTVGDMSVEERVGQMVAVPIEDVERSRGIARTLSRDLVGAVYARAGDTPAAGSSVAHWASLTLRIQTAAQRTRLRIPALVGAETLHGLGALGVRDATTLPHAIGIGATHNVSLAQLIGHAEMEQLTSAGFRWALGPTLSVCRDPRWGRCFECVGENERLVRMLNSRLDGMTGTEAVPGWNLLEKHQARLLPTARFFMAEGGTMNGRSGAGSSTDMVDDEGLRSMHLRPFFDANVRGVQMVMLGEGKVNGVPIHNNSYLVSILKAQYGYSGVLVSHFHGLSSLPTASFQEQVETLVNVGVDLILAPPGQHAQVLDALRRAVRRGTIKLERVNDAVRRLLRAKELAGHFDSPCSPVEPTQGNAPDAPANDDDSASVSPSPAVEPRLDSHKALARFAVQQSIVLLKNGGEGKDVVFPLPNPAELKDLGLTFYVGGSHADDIGRQCGGYTITSQGGSGSLVEGTTILKGFQDLLQAPSKVISLGSSERIKLEKGQQFPRGTYAVLAVGEEPYSGQEGDATENSLALSEESISLVQDTCSKVVCIVIIVSGRPLDITPILPHANAVVAAWLPGSEAGGIADLFLNDSLDFQGTLPLTWFRSTSEDFPLNYGDIPYNPLFPYGFGLTKTGVLLNGAFAKP